MTQMLHEILSMFLYVFSTLFPIVDPIGGAMFFLSLTISATTAQRRQLATRVTLYSFIMLIVCMWVGTFIMKFFGISEPVLRVSGGIVLAAAGWIALNEPASSTSDPASVTAVSPKELIEKAFYPLTLPLTIGPGTIAVSTAISSAMKMTVGNIIGANLACIATALTIWVCYAFSDKITAKLGATGSDAVVRIASFILLCIGVEILWLGLEELIVQAAEEIQHLPAH